MKIEIVNKTGNSISKTTIEKVLLKASSLMQLQQKNITIIIVDNQDIQKLNNDYRQMDKTTDVLTFPDGTLNHLGDVFISYDKCLEQAKDYGHSVERELGFLVVHGLLHTLGYDHHTEKEEKEMFELQEKILHKAKLYR